MLTMGATIVAGVDSLSKDLGLRQDDSTSAEVSRANSVRSSSHQPPIDRGTNLAEEEESDGVKAHGPEGEDIVSSKQGWKRQKRRLIQGSEKLLNLEWRSWARCFLGRGRQRTRRTNIGRKSTHQRSTKVSIDRFRDIHYRSTVIITVPQKGFASCSSPQPVDYVSAFNS